MNGHMAIIMARLSEVEREVAHKDWHAVEITVGRLRASVEAAGGAAYLDITRLAPQRALCACLESCGDVPEDHDALAVCKDLPRIPPQVDARGDHVGY